MQSLSTFFILSTSPFFTINQNNYRKFSLISNSHFSHSFTSVLYSNTNYHSTTLNNNIFKHILDSAIHFSSEYCGDNSQCCVSYKYDFKVGQSITWDFRSNLFPGNLAGSSGTDRHAIFLGGCGDIVITKSSFVECYTQTKSGGGLLIEQYCKVVLHNTVFDNCHSKMLGSAGAIAQQILVENDYPCHKLTHKLDIQYTCFQSCYSLEPGFGAALILGSKDVKFFYASTVDCPKHDAQNKQSFGAQFDILADSISSQYVNATGGNSIYCGAMEYRNATSGFFRYQTITKMNCKYAISFTAVDINNLTITTCNIFENSVHKAYNYDNEGSNPPALVFVQKKDLLVEDFYFSKNVLSDNAKLTSKENVDEITIILRGCYADTGNSQDWSNSYVKTENCHFSNNPIETCSILQLNLGSCQGQITPGQLIITSLFTESKEFSKSSYFSNSLQFTKTDMFSQSNKFTSSRSFTPSYEPGQTHRFTPSNSFTPSQNFSKSSVFTTSAIFSESSDFTKSVYFSNSDHFTKSFDFTKSLNFTKSFEFSDSSTFNLGNDSGSSGKNNTGVIIGAVVGAVAAAAIIGGIAAFFIIRKRRLAISDVDVVKETNSSVTVDNELDKVMDKDDPFANDFGNELQDI